MKGCPHCVEFKQMLDENSIKYIDRDIDIHEEEYDAFVEMVGNDFVPAFMIIDTESLDFNIKAFAPERDYNLVTEAIDIIKNNI